MRYIPRLAALASAPLLLMASSAAAQDTTLLCRADARTYCRPEALTRSRESIHVCLERNVDQISRDCRTLIRMTQKPPADRRPAS